MYTRRNFFGATGRPAFAGAMAAVVRPGVSPAPAFVIVTPIKHEEFEGIRVSPSVYTTFEELDRFGDAVQYVVNNGLPAS